MASGKKSKISTIVSPLPPPLASREPCQRPLSSARPGRHTSSRITSSDTVWCLRITWKFIVLLKYLKQIKNGYKEA